MAYASTVYTQLDKHENRLNKHDEQLNKHDDQISELEKCAMKNSTNINSLVAQIKWLTSSLWGVVLLLLAALVSYFLKG